MKVGIFEVITIMVKFDRKKLKEKFKKGFEKAVETYAIANQDVLIEPRYWEGFEGFVTHRKNGETVYGAYRNIVDTGNLANSQEVTKTGEFKAAYSWDGNGETPAIGVHEGRLENGRFIPGRPWTEVALSEVDLPRAFKEGFEQ